MATMNNNANQHNKFASMFNKILLNNSNNSDETLTLNYLINAYSKHRNNISSYSTSTLKTYKSNFPNVDNFNPISSINIFKVDNFNSVTLSNNNINLKEMFGQFVRDIERQNLHEYGTSHVYQGLQITDTLNNANTYSNSGISTTSNMNTSPTTQLPPSPKVVVNSPNSSNTIFKKDIKLFNRFLSLYNAYFKTTYSPISLEIPSMLSVLEGTEAIKFNNIKNSLITNNDREALYKLFTIFNQTYFANITNILAHNSFIHNKNINISRTFIKIFDDELKYVASVILINIMLPEYDLNIPIGVAMYIQNAQMNSGITDELLCIIEYDFEFTSDTFYDELNKYITEYIDKTQNPWLLVTRESSIGCLVPTLNRKLNVVYKYKCNNIHNPVVNCNGYLKYIECPDNDLLNSISLHLSLFKKQAYIMMLFGNLDMIIPIINKLIPFDETTITQLDIYDYIEIDKDLYNNNITIKIYRYSNDTELLPNNQSNGNKIGTYNLIYSGNISISQSPQLFPFITSNQKIKIFINDYITNMDSLIKLLTRIIALRINFTISTNISTYYTANNYFSSIITLLTFCNFNYESNLLFNFKLLYVLYYYIMSKIILDQLQRQNPINLNYRKNIKSITNLFKNNKLKMTSNKSLNQSNLMKKSIIEKLLQLPKLFNDFDSLNEELINKYSVRHIINIIFPSLSILNNNNNNNHTKRNTKNTSSNSYVIPNTPYTPYASSEFAGGPIFTGGKRNHKKSKKIIKQYN